MEKRAAVRVAEAKLEPQITKVLTGTSDAMTQCWAMSILSNIAPMKGSRDRQTAAIPALCKLVASSVPEVQHAAALHLARSVAPPRGYDRRRGRGRECR